ncbi:YczI family protein [Peribacillus frigoritolerans]|uniref:YczI family protein n=1 Tax=Peribacillus frigoritolerans TaxID=450367 RepID=UPI002E24F342
MADNDSLMETMPLTSEERKKINLNNLMNCTDLSGGSILLKIVRIILAIIVLTLSVYQLITDNFEVMPYSMLFLGALMLVIGLAELQKDRKGFGGYMCIVVSLFLFFVSIQDFLIY